MTGGTYKSNQLYLNGSCMSPFPESIYNVCSLEAERRAAGMFSIEIQASALVL